MSHALHFLILTVAGWLQRRMEAQIEYLIAENTVYKQRLGRADLRLTDAQRRRLATKAKAVGRKDLARIATTIATPDTILRWYRRLVAQKYDGSAKRGPDDLAFAQTSRRSSCGWLTRIRAGATRASWAG